VIVGAGYIGLEMAEGLSARGLAITQFEQLPEVLPTVDPGIGSLVNAELSTHGVDVKTGTTVKRISRAAAGSAGRFQIEAVGASGSSITVHADIVLVVVGVRPDTALAVSAGVGLGAGGAISVDRGMRTNLRGAGLGKGLPGRRLAVASTVADPPKGESKCAKRSCA
jgi:pyruvate/2-oxoglutarate dehydrogenase complex dihydrolipoamide dehydrogenase (E3) component